MLIKLFIELKLLFDWKPATYLRFDEEEEEEEKNDVIFERRRRKWNIFRLRNQGQAI